MVGDTDTFIVVLSDVTLGSIGTRNEAFISVVRESKELEFEFSTDYVSTKIEDISAHIDIIVHGELEHRRCCIASRCDSQHNQNLLFPVATI